jgi:hypothetical protein
VREEREKWAGGGELGHERVDGPAERNGPAQEKEEKTRERWTSGRKREGRGSEGVWGLFFLVFFQTFIKPFQT